MQRLWVFLHLVSLLTADESQSGEGQTSTSSSPQYSSSSTTSTTTAVPTGTMGNNRTNATSAYPTSVPHCLSMTTANQTHNQTDSQDLLEIFLEKVQEPAVLIAFGIGVVLTALLWCLTALCCRRKRKSSVNMSETLEMVSTQDPKLCGQQDESTQTNGGAEENEVEYSDLDFSVLKRQRAAEDVVRETAESEYAEIKKETTEEREQGATGESEGRVEEEERKEDTPACEQTEEDEQQSLWTEDRDK